MTATTTQLPSPTEDIVRSYVQKFDQEQRGVEHTLEKLFRLYPTNTAIEDVLPKVLVLNNQYSTGILATNQVAEHIVSKNIDPLLRQGHPDAVSQIAVVLLMPSNKIRNNYSFASKYCAWHNSCAYPIYDSFVEQMLWAYRKLDKFDKFRRQDLWEYPKFRRIVDSFRTHYGLTGYSLKEIDKFLWLAGQRYFPRDGQKETQREKEAQSP